MNVYSLAPLTAALAYIPLLITTAGSRPWQRRHVLFILFLVSAMVWSFDVFLYRSNLLPEAASALFKLTVILFAVMVVQFHAFTSSFYPQGQHRWLSIAYLSLAPITALVALGYVTGEITVVDGNVYSYYRIGIIFVSLPLLVFGLRNLYVFGKMLKHSNNPALHNQVTALMLGIAILLLFTIMSLPSWFNDFPISQYGNLINAFILS